MLLLSILPEKLMVFFELDFSCFIGFVCNACPSFFSTFEIVTSTTIEHCFVGAFSEIMQKYSQITSSALDRDLRRENCQIVCFEIIN